MGRELTVGARKELLIFVESNHCLRFLVSAERWYAKVLRMKESAT